MASAQSLQILSAGTFWLWGVGWNHLVPKKKKKRKKETKASSCHLKVGLLAISRLQVCYELPSQPFIFKLTRPVPAGIA